MKLGIVNNPRRSLFDEVQWIAERDFQYLDLLLEAPCAAVESVDWRQIADALKDADLAVVCQTPHYLPLNNPSPIVRQAALDEVRRAIDVAQLLEAPLLTLTFPGWPDHLSERSGYEFIEQMLGVLISHGQARQVDIALENSPQNQHQLKYFREIFHRQPDLKLTYDIGHGNVLTAATHTGRDYLFALSQHLAHVHLSDNNGLSDDHLLPGAPDSGGIDLDWEIRNLKNFRYGDSITLEIGGDRRWVVAFAALFRSEWQRI